jgi:hypothetical protein
VSPRLAGSELGLPPIVVGRFREKPPNAVTVDWLMSDSVAAGARGRIRACAARHLTTCANPIIISTAIETGRRSPRRATTDGFGASRT